MQKVRSEKLEELVKLRWRRHSTRRDLCGYGLAMLKQIFSTGKFLLVQNLKVKASELRVEDPFQDKLATHISQCERSVGPKYPSHNAATTPAFSPVANAD